DLHATSELLPSPTAPEIVVPSDDSGAFTWQRLAPLRVEPGDWLEDDSEVVDTNELPRPPQRLAPEPPPVPVRVASPPARPAAPARPWLPWLAAAVVVPVALWLAFAWVDAMESRRPLPALAAPSSPPATTVDGPAASPSARSEAPREIAPREAPTHAARADGPSLPSDVAPVTATSDPSEHERPATAGERARGETSAPNSSEELGGLLAPTIRRERRPRPLETEF
ncbi:MAG: hypothetical protein K1X94_32075, partial [Sandaracinaceae bacterium]|nr:hypothetical protein [Sandaracinaceae bacterium]